MQVTLTVKFKWYKKLGTQFSRTFQQGRWRKPRFTPTADIFKDSSEAFNGNELYNYYFKFTLTNGLILFGSLPSFFIASLMHARSTTAGTPVKSWQANWKTKEMLHH